MGTFVECPRLTKKSFFAYLIKSEFWLSKTSDKTYKKHKKKVDNSIFLTPPPPQRELLVNFFAPNFGKPSLSCLNVLYNKFLGFS